MTLLAFAFCYKQWVLLTIASGFQVVAIGFQFAWKAYMKKLDEQVSPLFSYNITLINIILEVGYLLVSIYFPIELMSRNENFTEYFYAWTALGGAALVLGMYAVVIPRLILLGGAEVYGDLEVKLWQERIQAHDARRTRTRTRVQVTDDTYT